MTNTFNRIEDLFTHFGTDSVKGLSRRFYKSTACGAWADVIDPGPKVEKVSETWTACLTKCIGGTAILHARKKGGRCLRGHDIPQAVLEYLLARPEQPHRSDLQPSELDTLSVQHEITKITRQGRKVFVTFTVPVPREVGTHKGALVVGTIVEGSDVEPCVQPRELWFPFTEDDLDHAIAEIEDEADDLWHQINASRYEIFQESPRLKAEWRKEIQARMPVGTRVKVLNYDIESYVGMVGEVVGYDTGCIGEWPMVSVAFDSGKQDGFYDDELEAVRPCSVPWKQGASDNCTCQGRCSEEGDIHSTTCG